MNWQEIQKIVEHQGFVSRAELSLKPREDKQIRVLASGSLDEGLSNSESTIHFLIKDI